MIVNESLFRDFLRVLVWYPVRWIIIILPVRLGIASLRLMGDIHCCFSRGKKRVLRENVLRVKPHAISKETLIKEYFRNYYIDRLFIFIFPRFGRKEVERFLHIDGLEHLEKALRKGKGVILVHGHFGPVHLPLVALARLGYKMKQIGNPTAEGISWIGRHLAFRLRMVYEQKIPADIIKANSLLRPVFRCLKANGIIMIAGDGSGTETHIGRHRPFSFFGYNVMFPLGPSLLSEKTGAGLLPIFIVPSRNKLYEIIIEEPFGSELNGNERVLDITRQFTRCLEHYVAQYPGYMHFLDRFHPGGIIINSREIVSLNTSPDMSLD